jgi:hypothetical protein
MKLPYSKLAAIVLCSLAAVTPALRAAELSETDIQFLTRYEQVRAALAKDNLDGAKKAALELGVDGTAIANADSIGAARNEFAALSERATKLAAGQSGYYVVNCPMLKKDWVQPRGAISNPYAGSSMPTCGKITKYIAPK